MLPTEFNQYICDRVLSMMWSQWSSLGVSGNVAELGDSSVVDPEALLLATLYFGRYDARLFDEVLDWLVTNGDLINLTRLNRMINDYKLEFLLPVLLSVSRFLEKKGPLSTRWNTGRLVPRKWQKPNGTEILFRDLSNKALPKPKEVDSSFSEFGLLREKVSLRGYSRNFSQQGIPTLLLQLRAFLGMSSRCEMICLLACSKGMPASQLSALSGYALRTTQETLSEMSRSGYVDVECIGKKRVYFVNQKRIGSLLGEETIQFPPQTQFFTTLVRIHSTVSSALERGGSEKATALLVREVLTQCTEYFTAVGHYQRFQLSLRASSDQLFECLIKDIQSIEKEMWPSEVTAMS